MAAVRVLEYLDRSGRSPWRRQSAAIAAAHRAWDDYKRCRKGAA